MATEKSNVKNVKTDVLIVGAGPAGLAAAIQIKKLGSQKNVYVIEKADQLGNHNLSGAVVEQETLNDLFDEICENWKDDEDICKLLSKKVEKDNIMFLLGKKLAVNIYPILRIANKLKISIGEMVHRDNYIISIGRLVKILGKIAENCDVKILTGFAAEDIIYDEQTHKVTGIKLVDQGLNEKNHKQPNFIAGEIITAEFVILAEGCDGLITETFIEKAGLKRKQQQLFSVGIKQIIKVTDKQYQNFTDNRTIHAIGYPLWQPVTGPAIFGGAIMYPVSKNHIAVGIIAAADWKYKDFNPQEALAKFKKHRLIKKFIEGGTVTQAGAHMIAEGGVEAIPMSPVTKTIGQRNCLIVGEAAGFVNMLKIKGLTNAIDSGLLAAEAISQTDDAEKCAKLYTEKIKQSKLYKDMEKAANFRQTISKFGLLLGFPISMFAKLLPKFKIEPDYNAMKNKSYRYKQKQEFDKNSFVSAAMVASREKQPCHLIIKDFTLCKNVCKTKFGWPCVTFCPAGVYELIEDNIQPANPSNCLHCKLCQRKCPLDNIKWTVPEGTSGPRYETM